MGVDYLHKGSDIVFWSISSLLALTHRGRVRRTAPSHYLNQCWIIVNWTFETKFSQILNAIHGRKQGPGGDSSSNALPENRHFFYKTCKIYVLFTQRSFDISRHHFHICNFAVIRYQLLWPNCCKTSTFGDIKAVTTQVWSGDHQQSERRAFTQTKPWRLRDVGLLPRIIYIFSFKKWI